MFYEKYRHSEFIDPASVVSWFMRNHSVSGGWGTLSDVGQFGCFAFNAVGFSTTQQSERPHRSFFFLNCCSAHLGAVGGVVWPAPALRVLFAHVGGLGYI